MGDRWDMGTIKRAQGRQQYFLSSKRTDNIASTAPKENIFCFYIWLVLAAVLLKAFSHLQPSKCPSPEDSAALPSLRAGSLQTPGCCLVRNIYGKV